MNRIVLMVLTLSLFSCAGAPKKNEPPSPPKIAYVTMEKLFFTARKSWRDVDRLEKQMQALMTRRAAVSALAEREPANPIHRKDLARIEDERETTAGQLKKLKDEIMKEIHTAVKRVAEREKIDFVAVMGEGFIYGREGSDITGLVIVELDALRARTEPASR